MSEATFSSTRHRFPLPTSSPPATERLHLCAPADWLVAGAQVLRRLRFSFHKITTARVRRNLSGRACDTLCGRPAMENVGGAGFAHPISRRLTMTKFILLAI